jgi:MAF protein
LSLEKAQALTSAYCSHLIIGSDQVAAAGDTLLGKPGNIERAARQLRLASNNRIKFYTSVTLLNSKTGEFKTQTDITTVHFRDLTDNEIRAYLETEQPYDCAGSFKVEGLGIALFKRIDNSDPTALIGLPLIRLTTMLGDMGVRILNK